MVSKPDTGRCVSEDAGHRMGWIVRSHISCRTKRFYKGVKTSY